MYWVKTKGVAIRVTIHLDQPQPNNVGAPQTARSSLSLNVQPHQGFINTGVRIALINQGCIISTEGNRI